MIPKDLYQKHERHPALDRAIELAEKEYPNLEINIARDGGDIIELLLYDMKDYNYSNCILFSYNKWYDEPLSFSLTLKE